MSECPVYWFPDKSEVRSKCFDEALNSFCAMLLLFFCIQLWYRHFFRSTVCVLVRVCRTNYIYKYNIISSSRILADFVRAVFHRTLDQFNTHTHSATIEFGGERMIICFFFSQQQQQLAHVRIRSLFVHKYTSHIYVFVLFYIDVLYKYTYSLLL